MSLMRFSGRIVGRVQGVGFRFFTQKTALQFQLSGWVKNEPDGSVTFEAQGDKGHLEPFLDLLKKGPAFSKVTDYNFNEEALLDQESDFRILR